MLSYYTNGRRIHTGFRMTVDDINLSFDIQVFHGQNYQNKTPMVAWVLVNVPALSDITLDPEVKLFR